MQLSVDAGDRHRDGHRHRHHLKPPPLPRLTQYAGRELKLMTTCCNWPFHSRSRNISNQRASSLHSTICRSRSADTCFWLASVETRPSADRVTCSKWTRACRQQHTPVSHHSWQTQFLPTLTSSFITGSWTTSLNLRVGNSTLRMDWVRFNDPTNSVKALKEGG